MNNVGGKTIESEIKYIRSFKYEQLCRYLQKKYGEVGGPYFINEKCRTKNEKIKRTGEGLFIHHIYENKAIMLSHTEYATQFPYEWQEGQNLVYCNYFEHMLLHVAIVKEHLKAEAKKTRMAVGIGGLINYMIPEIIDYINGYEYSRDYMKKALSVVDGNELLFIDIVKDLQDYILNDHEVFSIVYSTIGGPNKRKAMLDAFKSGKMIKRGRFNDLLFAYDVVKKDIKLIDSFGFASMVEKALAKPGYDYNFDIRPHGDYYYVGFSYYNKNNHIVFSEYALSTTDIISFDNFEKQYFRKLICPGKGCWLIKKNSNISYKEIKEYKNGNKRYCITVDGIVTNRFKCSKEQAIEIVNNNK